MKNVHIGHRKRMRNKFLEGHSESFCDHELLEMLLFYCIPVANTNVIAHELINHFGSISEVFKADTDELLKINGISIRTAEKIALVKQCMDRCGKSCKENPEFSDLDSMAEYYVNYFKDVESDMCLFISTDLGNELVNRISIPLKIIAERKISVNDIAKMLIKKNMHRIVIGINHSDRNFALLHTDCNMVQFFSEKFEMLDIITENYFVFSKGKLMYVNENPDDDIY